MSVAKFLVGAAFVCALLLLLYGLYLSLVWLDSGPQRRMRIVHGSRDGRFYWIAQSRAPLSPFWLDVTEFDKAADAEQYIEHELQKRANDTVRDRVHL